MGVRSIPAALDRAARHWPDGMAIEDGEVRLTWLQLREQANQAARALVRRGIEPGDRVAIWAPNTWEWVVVGLGIHCAGAAIVTLNTRYKGHEARYILDRSGSKMLFTVDGFLGLDFARMLERPELPTVCFRTSAFGDFMAEGLEDARLPEMLFRYRARKYPETLSPGEREDWEAFRFAWLTDPDAGASICLEQYQADIEERLDAPGLEASQRQLLEALMEYGDSLLA